MFVLNKILMKSLSPNKNLNYGTNFVIPYIDSGPSRAKQKNMRAEPSIDISIEGPHCIE